MPQGASLRKSKYTYQEALELTKKNMEKGNKAMLELGLNLPTGGFENRENYDKVLKALNFFESLGQGGQKQAEEIRKKLKEDFYSSI